MAGSLETQRLLSRWLYAKCGRLKKKKMMGRGFMTRMSIEMPINCFVFFYIKLKNAFVIVVLIHLYYIRLSNIAWCFCNNAAPDTSQSAGTLHVFIINRLGMQLLIVEGQPTYTDPDDGWKVGQTSIINLLI